VKGCFQHHGVEPAALVVGHVDGGLGHELHQMRPATCFRLDAIDAFLAPERRIEAGRPASRSRHSGDDFSGSDLGTPADEDTGAGARPVRADREPLAGDSDEQRLPRGIKERLS
jgi:hypothetical protein